MPSTFSVTDRLTVATASLATLLWVVATPVVDTASAHVGLVMLLFGCLLAAECVPLVMEFRGEGMHSTLSGIVIVVGVIFVGPVPTMVVRVATGVIALAVRWRVRGEKLRFNASLQFLEVWILAAVYVALVAAAPLLSGRTVMAIVVATVASETSVSVMVLVAIRTAVGPLQLSLVRATGLAVVVNIAITATSATVATRLLAVEPVSALAFAGVLGLLMATNHSRHTMSARFRSVTHLYSFMEHMQETNTIHGLLSAILEQAREVTGALRVSIVIEFGGFAQQIHLIGSGLVSSDPVGIEEARTLIADARSGLDIAEDHVRPSPTITGPPGGQLLVMPFAHPAIEGVLLVDGRHPRLPSFNDDDRALAQALARHAGSALASSRLLDELRMRTYQLERSALRDPQTGIRNYDGLLDHVPTLEAGTVVVAELVDLEMIDTAFGHGLSEQVAASTADRLQDFAKREGFTAARIGPARFAVVMSGVEHRLDARVCISELRASLTGPLASTRLNMEARFALSAASAPDHGTDVGELVRRASSALLENPGSALTDVAWFTADLDAAATDRLDLASDLRAALDNGGLSLAYQPKVDLATGRISGVEALARWAHPTRGYIPPDTFVDIAERTGLIRSLTIWVANEAIQQAARWADEGQRLSVAINLSTATLEDPSLADWIIECCRINGVPGHRIILEITESQMMGDHERGSGILAMFDAAGMRLSVDDFGTGYSSLAQLKALPVDEVKIDRGFITNLATDVEDRALTEAIIRMCRSLNLHVVAEGIEDQIAMDILLEQGCDTGQGYFLHRPISAAEVGEILRNPVTAHGTAAPPRERVVQGNFEHRRLA